MTREEAIERLEFHKQVWMMVGGIDLSKVLDMAIAALREQDDHFREATKKDGHKWISVEEALPPDQSDVLVVVLCNGEWRTMTGWLSCVTHEWRCVTPYGEHEPEKVTYWMPLPSPEVEV